MNFRSCARDPGGPVADAAEPAAAPLPLGRDGGPRLSRAHARRAGAGVAARRGRRLARRQRAAEVARREPGATGPSPRRSRSRRPTISRRAGGISRRWSGALYTARFLATLKTKAAEVRARFPEAAGKIDLPRALRRAHVLGVRRRGQRARSTGSPAPTTTIAARARSGTCPESRRRPCASRRRTTRFCRPRRSNARARLRRRPWSFASRRAAATSGSCRGRRPGGRVTGPRSSRSTGSTGRCAEPGPELGDTGPERKSRGAAVNRCPGPRFTKKHYCRWRKFSRVSSRSSPRSKSRPSCRTARWSRARPWSRPSDRR